MRPPERPNRAVEKVAVQSSYPSTHPLSSSLWQLSHSLADIGLVILLAVALLALIAHHAGLGRTLAGWVPRPVRAFFQSSEMAPGEWGNTLQPNPAAGIQAPERARERAVRIPKRRATATFALGSTEAEVRAAQGPPDEATGTVWRYGNSEVYFLNGRVVNWREDPASPLRVVR